MDIGKFLQRMDSTYYHHNHRPLGWIWCDLLDYHYGVSAKTLLREECDGHHPLRVPFLACALLAFKLSNLRVKWGEPIRVDNDESDTTAAEFNEMWKDGEPTETVGLLDLKDWDCEEDAVYDWADDDTMSAEETMRRVDELGPDVEVTGPPPIDPEAQCEYDESPALQRLLKEAAESPTFSRPRRKRRTE